MTVGLAVVGLLAVGCAGSVADERTLETVAQRPTATPFPTLAAAPPTSTPLPSTSAGTADASETARVDGDSQETASASTTDDSSTESSNTQTADSGPAFTDRSKVTTVGLDEVFFGMTADAASAAASTQWTRGTGVGSCTLLTPTGGPDGVAFWLWDGTVERVDITNADIRTPSGWGVGSTVTDLQTSLGDRLTVTDNSDGTQTATFVPADEGDAGFRLIFEAAGGVVTWFRSGRTDVAAQPSTECA